MLVVIHDRQTPQHACAAGARSTARLRSGNAFVFVRSSTVHSVLHVVAGSRHLCRKRPVQLPETGFERPTAAAATVTPRFPLVPCTNAQSFGSMAAAPSRFTSPTCVFFESATVVEPCEPLTVTVSPFAADTFPNAKPKFARPPPN